MPEQPEASVEAAGTGDFPAPNFDVRDFARTAAGSHRESLALESYRVTPLTEDTLRALRYLQIIERATMTHLRSVLVTATHKDARITAFLVTWAYEKYWIADALEQIILAHQPEGAEADRSPFKTPVERTIRESVFANIVGVPMIAVHMSLGTVDEWLTQAAYRRLGDLDSNAQLAATVADFLDIKERQLDFFEAQARFRLTESPRARSLTRKRLAKTPWPIGAKAEPDSETSWFLTHLFSGAPEVVDEIDARVDTLPGQSGLRLIRKAARL
ncbi:hypothetical protein [Schumannella luteola]